MSADPPGEVPVFIDVPGRPDQVERCDWDAQQNEYSCKIIQRSRLPKRARVRRAGRVSGSGRMRQHVESLRAADRDLLAPVQ